MDVGDLHRRTVGVWTAAVDEIRPQQWDDPTPCTAWTVRDLVNHVAGEDAWTVPLMRGQTIADVGDTLDGDLLADHPIDTALRLAEEAVAVVAERLPAGEPVHLSYGEEEPGEYLRQLAADHLVHAWDVLVAVGADPVLPADLVDEVADWFAEREALYRSAGAVAERPPYPGVEGDADAQTRLLAGFGRDAGWAP